MTAARPPQPSGDNFKTWGARLNDYLVRTRSQLVQYAADSSAVDDGMLVWDADNTRVLYSSGGAWIPIAGTGGNPASLFYNGSAKITATADGVTAFGDITLSGFPESTYELKGDVDGAVRFHAVATEALSKGDVVYIVQHASSGSETKVAKALASDAAKMPAFGLALNNAAIDAAVQIVTFGNLYGSGGAGNALNTNAYNSGTPLYVSATTAGEWTGTIPAGESNFIQNIGKVVRKQQTNGVIKVGGAGRTNATPNLNNGNIFIGDSNNQAVTTSLATQVSALETSHNDVLVDGDFTSNGFMKRTGAGTYAIDSNTYLTTHQDISGKADLSGADFTGDVSVDGDIAVTGTVDGVDVGNLKYHDVDYFMLRDGYTQTLTTALLDIGTYTNIYDAATPVPTMRILDLTAEVNWLDTIYNGNTYQNDLEIRFQVIVPSGTTNAVSLGSVTQVTSSGYTVGSSYQKWFYVSGDVTHHFSDFGKIHENSSGGSFERSLYSYQYNPSQNRTYFSISTYPTVYANGTTVYWHPYQWESAGVLLTDYRYADEKGRSGQETLPFMCKTAYDDRNMTYRIKIRELSSSSTQPDKAQIGQTMLKITQQEP